MKTSDFDYDLPEELIAQAPLKNRTASRLLVLDRKNRTYEDKTFTDVLDYLDEGDALVINDTKVIPARLIGVKESTLAKIELLLLKNTSGDVWNALSKPQKRLKRGTIVSFGDGLLKAEILDILDEGMVNVKLIYKGILNEVLDKLGEMPLPPYIHEKLKEKDRYQTVYAKNEGSSAAPTAGLHFTKELLKKIEEKGVKIVNLTLHVGLGTFRPVNAINIKDHKMHSEYYVLSEKAAKTLKEVRANNKKVIAVGTTSVRTLETVYDKYSDFKACSGETSIFIYPGFEFKAVDAIITNFHLPKSTLLMLVSAFADKDFILDAYKHAVDEKYRFFSFGDAMLIK